MTLKEFLQQAGLFVLMLIVLAFFVSLIHLAGR